jgi:putative PEP-CTERM system TPR-repeat lipoprotein
MFVSFLSERDDHRTHLCSSWCPMHFRDHTIGRSLSRLAVAMAIVAIATACSRDADAAKRRFIASGDRYAAVGKYSEAVLEYRNAVQKAPRAGDAREKLAEALARTGNLGAALGEFVRAADLLPGNLPLQLKAGNLLLLAGRFDDAKVRGETVLAKDKRNVDAEILVANAHAGLKDLDGAVAEIEDALKIDPERGATYSSLGILELSRGKRTAAEQAFLKAVEHAPHSASAHLALGNFRWLTGDTVQAEESFKRALEIDSRNPLTNRILANFYIAIGRGASAQPFLQTAFDATKTPQAAFALADYFISRGNVGAARDLLQALVSDPGASAFASVRLAELDFKAGHRDEAYSRLTAVLAKDEANLQALLTKSALLASDQRLDDALTSADLAAQRHPKSTSAFFMVGRIQSARRQPDAAIAAYQEVLRLNPRAIQAKIALAHLHLAQGRPETSIGFAQEALANEPKNGEAQLVFVRGLLARGDLDRASSELKQLIARFPESAAVHAQMGMLLGRRRDLAGARREFERSVQLDPSGLEGLGGLVVLDLTARDFVAARSRVDDRLRMSETPALLVLAARTYAASSDVPTAEKFLRRAIDLDAGYMAAYGALGQLYVSQGKLDEARAEFEVLAKQSSKPVAALTMLGLILQAKGDVDGARGRFERALQIDPEAGVAANNLAWIYAETGGNLDVALHFAQVAQQRLPGMAEVGDTLGYIYYKKHFAPLAISTLTVSTEKDPGNAIYQYHLGLAYAAAGDAKRAKQVLARALELKSDFDGAHEARELLSSLTPR